MASLMGMNRYFADEGIKGLGNAATLQTQRENAQTQMEAAQDATKKGTMSSLAGGGAMLGATMGGTGAAAATATTAATAGTGMAGTLGVGTLAAGAATAGIGLAVGALAGWLFSEFM